MKSNFDPELQRLRAKMNEIEVEMEKVFQKAAKELDLEAGKSLKVSKMLLILVLTLFFYAKGNQFTL